MCYITHTNKICFFPLAHPLRLLPPPQKGLTPANLLEIFADFVSEARQLQSEYEGRMDILVGMETEYTGAHSLELAGELVSKYSLDYIVGSVHHVNGYVCVRLSRLHFLILPLALARSFFLSHSHYLLCVCG